MITFSYSRSLTAEDVKEVIGVGAVGLAGWHFLNPFSAFRYVQALNKITYITGVLRNECIVLQHPFPLPLTDKKQL
ncbi:hypothetical protein BN3590_03595 [Clostridium sp. C105KSO15]|nr:hypothetical protein BN3590_03595 [Clostridium sp. C105KSO15]